MYVIISGIKSEKTKNKIVNSLLDHFTEVTALGSTGNYQVKVNSYYNPNPVLSLKEVTDAITNLTPDHLANLKWKVTK